ncbi:MAG: type II toxin-antitoxin system VapC family toxin [Candidatus Eremiobacteraeota bacterium]|nr:type II toxin-antitoxin system VapC family toxin [Candidatus Eremiobacteraeota bacterium]MBC5803618.1 type II toxin-antitoxin system VapC family toxin [Candidatus Eremiobacteraeota bacterium]MBC5821944.1 type II toxin-antitoxin system VapC family toxin [Candidatus Eremiobacteraeota bacterium]
MIVDTSALIAILRDEPEADSFRAAIVDAPVTRIGAPTLLEASLVIERAGGAAALGAFDRFITEAGMEVVPFDAAFIESARRAYRTFGKGLHVAGLNFGDCFSYALAHATAEPLLFKGNDFSQTDIASAV